MNAEESGRHGSTKLKKHYSEIFNTHEKEHEATKRRPFFYLNWAMSARRHKAVGLRFPNTIENSVSMWATKHLNTIFLVTGLVSN